MESVTSTKAAKVAAAKAASVTAAKTTAPRESYWRHRQRRHRCQNCKFHSHHLASVRIKLPMITTCASVFAKHRANFARTQTLCAVCGRDLILCHASISRLSDASFQKN
jgi:hypothetical protein